MEFHITIMSKEAEKKRFYKKCPWLDALSKNKITGTCANYIMRSNGCGLIFLRSNDEHRLDEVIEGILEHEIVHCILDYRIINCSRTFDNIHGWTGAYSLGFRFDKNYWTRRYKI